MTPSPSDSPLPRVHAVRRRLAARIAAGRRDPRPRRGPSRVAGLTATLAGAATAGALLLPVPAAAQDNPRTPRSFTGYGFDQCLAPEQAKMNRWLQHSPFFSVGIYISGDSRGCRNQPNLTPRWIRTQLAKGWRLLPITLGPQASCHPDFPRYDDDVKINPRPGSDGQYRRARRQGRAEATKTVAEAQRLGLRKGSTLWYDLEGFDSTQHRCRESALRFLSAWTWRLHSLGYRSGVYSSAGSGIRMLDDARVNRPRAFVLPDYIWIARWDGVANTSTSYIREDGWQPHRRVKQYLGGHDETWGGVTINIDRNFLDVGRGSRARPEEHCGGVDIDLRWYPALRRGVRDVLRVKALQCLLKEKGYYRAPIHGFYGRRVIRAVQAWQADRGFPRSSTWSQRNWVALLSQGRTPVLKYGSAGGYVRRVQRAVNAANGAAMPITGVFGRLTDRHVRGWQSAVGLTPSGVIGNIGWRALQNGRASTRSTAGGR